MVRTETVQFPNFMAQSSARCDKCGDTLPVTAKVGSMVEVTCLREGRRSRSGRDSCLTHHNWQLIERSKVGRGHGLKNPLNIDQRPFGLSKRAP